MSSQNTNPENLPEESSGTFVDPQTTQRGRSSSSQTPHVGVSTNIEQRASDSLFSSDRQTSNPQEVRRLRSPPALTGRTSQDSSLEYTSPTPGGASNAESLYFSHQRPDSQESDRQTIHGPAPRTAPHYDAGPSGQRPASSSHHSHSISQVSAMVRSPMRSPHSNGAPSSNSGPASSGNHPPPLEVGPPISIPFTEEQLQSTAVRDLQTLLANHSFTRTRLTDTLQYCQELYNETSGLRGHIQSLTGNVRRTIDDTIRHIRDGDEIISAMRERYVRNSPTLRQLESPPPIQALIEDSSVWRDPNRAGRAGYIPDPPEGTTGASGRFYNRPGNPPHDSSAPVTNPESNDTDHSNIRTSRDRPPHQRSNSNSPVPIIVNSSIGNRRINETLDDYTARYDRRQRQVEQSQQSWNASRPDPPADGPNNIYPTIRSLSPEARARTLGRLPHRCGFRMVQDAHRFRPTPDFEAYAKYDHANDPEDRYAQTRKTAEEDRRRAAEINHQNLPPESRVHWGDSISTRNQAPGTHTIRYDDIPSLAATALSHAEQLHNEVLLAEIRKDIDYKVGIEYEFPSGTKKPSIADPPKFKGSKDHREFKKWLSSFLDWLRTHGNCYDSPPYTYIFPFFSSFFDHVTITHRH